MLAKAALLIALLFFMGCVQPSSPAAAGTLPEIVEETQEMEDVLPEEEIIDEPPLIESEPEPAPEEEPVIVEEEPVLFDPELTYEGMYNGPLYATSEQIGNFTDKETYMENLTRNGVNYFIGMFAIIGEQQPENLASHDGLGYVVDLVERYPGRVVPFYGSGFGGEELALFVKNKGSEWLALYEDVLTSSTPIVGGDFLKGFGEVETQEWAIGHDHPSILKVVDLAAQNGKHVMFHPVAEKLDDVETLIEKYPDTIFLIHMYREDLSKGRTQLIEMMQTHDNLFYSIDAAHIAHLGGNDILYSYADDFGSKAGTRFLDTMSEEFSTTINSAVKDYRPLVEAVPDKVMWGTEAGPSYSFEPEVYDMLIKVSRSFIAKVSTKENVRRALAYENALSIFGKGVTLTEEINVIDASNWPLCDLDEIDKACAHCGLSDDEDEEINPAAEACESVCITEFQCIDPIDED